MSSVPESTHDLLAFIEASPTPWHCVAECVRRLEEAGWQPVAEGDADWPSKPGARLYATRGDGSIIAWKAGTSPAVETGFRLLGAHTDSPNLRIKPAPDRHKVGYSSIGLEPYGGVLFATWADRDLGVAGRVSLAGKSEQVETRLLRVDRPICRIPNLAIHLNRNVNSEGLKLNKQDHLPAVWALAEQEERGSFQAWLGEELGEPAEQILGWDLCLFDTQAPSIGGRNDEFIHAPRLDNQASCHAALAALLDAADEDQTSTAVIALFDHEEIGSRSSRGAAGSFVRDVLARLAGDGASDLSRALAHSFMISADMAHGVHPNYADKHDAQHRPMLNGGPVLKTHSEWRYATDAECSALFRSFCRDAGVPMQEFVNRSDLRCGSTIGPIVSASLGVRGVDVGNAMWSMHSIRETGGSQDQPHMIAVMRHFLGWSE